MSGLVLRAALLITLVWTLACSQTVAEQSLQADLPRPPSGADRLGGFSYFEGRLLFEGVSLHTVEFFAYSDRAHRTPNGRIALIPFARFNARPQEGSDNGVARWADGRSCPQLHTVMAEFSDIPAPRFSPPDFDDEPSDAAGAAPYRPASTEPVVYAVWGRARQADSSVAHMRLEAYNGFVAEWVRSASDRLAECWRDERPRELSQ